MPSASSHLITHYTDTISHKGSTLRLRLTKPKPTPFLSFNPTPPTLTLETYSPLQIWEPHTLTPPPNIFPPAWLTTLFTFFSISSTQDQNTLNTHWHARSFQDFQTLLFLHLHSLSFGTPKPGDIIITDRPYFYNTISYQIWRLEKGKLPTFTSYPLNNKTPSITRENIVPIYSSYYLKTTMQSLKHCLKSPITGHNIFKIAIEQHHIDQRSKK